MKLRILALCLCVAPVAALAADSPSAATVQSALTASMPAKLAVAEGFFKTGHWASSNAEAGYISPTDNPAKISVGQAGVITVAFSGPVITLTPTDSGKGQVTWACTATGFAAGVLPAECR